jgi:hypothetical protein
MLEMGYANVVSLAGGLARLGGEAAARWPTDARRSRPACCSTRRCGTQRFARLAERLAVRSAHDALDEDGVRLAAVAAVLRVVR